MAIFSINRDISGAGLGVGKGKSENRKNICSSLVRYSSLCRCYKPQSVCLANNHAIEIIYGYLIKHVNQPEMCFPIRRNWIWFCHLETEVKDSYGVKVQLREEIWINTWGRERRKGPWRSSEHDSQEERNLNIWTDFIVFSLKEKETIQC